MRSRWLFVVSVCCFSLIFFVTIYLIGVSDEARDDLFDDDDVMGFLGGGVLWSGMKMMMR